MFIEIRLNRCSASESDGDGRNNSFGSDAMSDDEEEASSLPQVVFSADSLNISLPVPDLETPVGLVR